MPEVMEEIKKDLLTGVSYFVPFIASGGILIALATAFSPMGAHGADISASPLLKLIFDIGRASFALMLPVLAGYIAYARAGRPALVAGMVGGQISGTVGAGFLGALVAGLLAGWIVDGMKRLPLPSSLRPVMPILVIPMASTVVVGMLMFTVIGAPVASLLAFLGTSLANNSAENAVILGTILGTMIAFDMGGPINKTAFFFGSALLGQGNPHAMGAIAAAICVPPLGLGLATKLNRAAWTGQERKAGSAALAMGLIGITEGAIPFAATDPLRVIPTICFGSAVASIICMLSGVGDHAPHGGPIVLPVIDNPGMYLVAIVVGAALTAITINLIKPRQAAPTAGNTGDP